MRAILPFILVLVMGRGLWAQEASADIQCVSCWEPCPASIALGFQSPCFLEAQPICPACSKVKVRCFECGLPIKSRGKQLEDGRSICGLHVPKAVENSQEAFTLFREAQRDLMHMFSGFGSLPEANIKLELVDPKAMGQLLKRGGLLHPAESAVGLTQTTKNPKGRPTHQIWILTGMSPNRFSAVAAHEYTHCWLAENVNRAVEPATVEGFCELMAHQLMVRRGDVGEQRVIMANTYTQGRIQALQNAAESYQVPQIIDWIKRGRDRSVSPDQPEQVLALSYPRQPSLHQLGQPQKTPVPDSLMLKGISGNGARRFALVNDRTLERNELGRVRVGETNLTVRCLEISERSVVLQVVSTGERKELFLPPERK